MKPNGFFERMRLKREAKREAKRERLAALEAMREEQAHREEQARREAEEAKARVCAAVARAKTGRDVLQLCDALPPATMRFMKSEQPLWVFPDATYCKTVKHTSYVGGSRGASFRVAKGVTLRTSGSRGRRVEEESMEAVDIGVMVVTTKHLYFQGTDKERFRVRLDRIVTIEPAADGMKYQRDGVRARPEVFLFDNGWLLPVLLDWIEDPDGAADTWNVGRDDDDDDTGMLAAVSAEWH